MALSLDSIVSDVSADRRLTPARLAALEVALPEGAPVSRAAADQLFRINRAIAPEGAADWSWSTFFTSRVTQHLLGDEASPRGLDFEEAQYLRQQLNAEGRLTPSERRLVMGLLGRADQVSPQFFGLAFELIRAAAAAAGWVDDDLADLINASIHHGGGDEGIRISASEAELLIEVKNLTREAVFTREWSKIFVHSLTGFLLTDLHSPGAVSEAEAEWILKHVDVDDPRGVEVDLLRQLKALLPEAGGRLQAAFASIG